MRHLIGLLLALMMLTLGGCEIIGDIFSAGFYAGIFVVILVVVIIIYVISRFRRR